MHDSGYCWRPECIYPYESLRSMLGKFMILNHIDLAALNHVHWCKGSEGRKQYLFNSETILITKKLFRDNKIDRSAFQSILGLTDEQFRYSTIDPFYEKDNCEFNYLRFCPSCLEMGFHSPFHQLKMFSKCIIHGSELVTSCINCHLPVPYSLQSGDHHPFGCTRCGHVFMSTERLVENKIGNQIPELADFIDSFLAKRYESNLIFEKRVIPSYVWPPEKVFQHAILCNSAPKAMFEREQQMTPYRWADAFNLDTNWLHKSSYVRPPRHTRIVLREHYSINIIEDKPTPIESFSLKPVYKSIKRHFRKHILKPNGSLWRLRILCEIGERAGGSVITSTEDTRCVLAAAYIQLSLHLDCLMNEKIEVWHDCFSRLPEQHSELIDLARCNQLSLELKKQLISRILADDCYSGYIEFVLRALVQRKKKRLVFDTCYRDKRYDSHWLIHVGNGSDMQLHFWSSRPSLESIFNYVQRHGY